MRGLPDDAVGQQHGQPAMDRRVWLAQDERQFCGIDERHPSEGVEQLLVGEGHVLSVMIERHSGQPARGNTCANNSHGLLCVSFYDTIRVQQSLPAKRR